MLTDEFLHYYANNNRHITLKYLCHEISMHGAAYLVKGVLYPEILGFLNSAVVVPKT